MRDALSRANPPSSATGHPIVQGHGFGRAAGRGCRTTFSDRIGRIRRDLDACRSLGGCGPGARQDLNQEQAKMSAVAKEYAAESVELPPLGTAVPSAIEVPVF